MAGVKNRGLGKGLEALFGDVEIEASEASGEIGRSELESGDSVRFIDINDIKPNSAQPRQVFDEEKISELAASIAAHGVIQPVLLKRSGGGFELVAGERRWRAARKAGLKKVPGIIRELTKEQLAMISLIENIQREDLNPMEEAEAFKRICDDYGLKQEEVSKSVGKSRPYITNSLRLLKLPEEIRTLVLEGKLTNGHARALVSIGDVKRQLYIADKIVSEGMSVREAENLARGTGRKNAKPPKNSLEKSTEIVSIEEELRDILGTKVTLKNGKKSGRLEIDYFSREELERLIEFFRGSKRA